MSATPVITSDLFSHWPPAAHPRLADTPNGFGTTSEGQSAGTTAAAGGLVGKHPTPSNTAEKQSELAAETASSRRRIRATRSAAAASRAGPPLQRAQGGAGLGATLQGAGAEA